MCVKKLFLKYTFSEVYLNSIFGNVNCKNNIILAWNFKLIFFKCIDFRREKIEVVRLVKRMYVNGNGKEEN